MRDHLPIKRLIDKKLLRSYCEQLQGLTELNVRVVGEMETLFRFGEREPANHISMVLEGHLVGVGVVCANETLTEMVQLFIQGLLTQGAQKALLAQEILDKYREINSIFQLSNALTNTKFTQDVAEAILKEFLTALPGQSGSLWLYQKGRETQDLNRIANQGTEVLPEEIERECVSYFLRNRPIADIHMPPMEPPFPPSLNVPILLTPLIAKEQILGCVLLAGPTKRVYTSGDIKLSVTLASESAYSLQASLLFEEIEQVFDSMMRSMIAAIDERDSATSGHSARISMICEKFAKAVNRTMSGKYADFSFSKEQLREIRYAGLLHDIGKIGVREEVLKKKDKVHAGTMDAVISRIQLAELALDRDLGHLKAAVLRANQAYNLSSEDLEILYQMRETQVPLRGGEKIPLLKANEFESLSVRHGNLTHDEIQEMRKHPAGSYKILSKIQFSKDLRQVPVIAAQHHEKLDGSGYPLGLSEKDILLQSQIMCIADIYEALIAKDRPYKPPLGREESLAIIEREVNEGKIDPELYQIFKDNLDAIVGSGK